MEEQEQDKKNDKSKSCRWICYHGYRHFMISQDTSNVSTPKDNLPSTFTSVPYTETSVGPTDTFSSSASQSSSPSSQLPTVSPDALSTSTESEASSFKTLAPNSSESPTLHSSSEEPSNISENFTTSSTNPTSSSPSVASRKTAFTPRSFSTSPSSATESSSSSQTTINSEPTNKSGEVSSTEEPSRTDFSFGFTPPATTKEVPAGSSEMTDEPIGSGLDRRAVVGSTSNNSASELPKIHFTLFTDWWHATILLGIEVFFYIITLGIIYFMRRNNIRWPQVLQDDSDSQSDTEPFG